MRRKRQFKSTTSRGSVTAPGAEKSLALAGYQEQASASGQGAAGSAQRAGRAYVAKGSQRAPTYRSSYVTYESQESSKADIPATVIEMATPSQSPVPQGKGELVFAAGTGLILISGFTNKHIQAILDLLTHGKDMKYTRQQARVGMVVVGGEFLFLMILTAFSEQSDAFSNVALMLIFALFLVWGVNNVASSSKWVDFVTGKAKNI